METEHALIGALLHSPADMVTVMGLVKPDYFSNAKARKCYVKMAALFIQGKPIDPALIVADDIGLGSYLAEASDKGGPFCHEYAREIRTAAKSRRINTELTNIQKEKAPPQLKLDRLLDLYQTEMEIGRKDSKIKDVMGRFKDALERNSRRGSLGIKTGFPFLQEAYIEFCPGDIWTIGGFTSVGKTALMVEMICRLINHDKPPRIVIVSTEMTEAQLVARILGNLSRIAPHRILTSNLYAGEEEALSTAYSVLSEAPLMVYDDIRALEEIEIAARKADLQGGVDIVFIDYVQNCTVLDATSQYQEQSTLAKRLQALAKDVSATVICLSQVSNEVGRGVTKQLELKGAGEWAAVSDVGVYLERHSDNECLLAFLVKKNRHGTRPEFKLEFKNGFTRLEDAGDVTRR